MSNVIKNIESIDQVPLGKTVSVRVKGEKARLTPVTLKADRNDAEKVVVLNGRRGRPRHLSADQITEVRVLAEK